MALKKLPHGFCLATCWNWFDTKELDHVAKIGRSQNMNIQKLDVIYACILKYRKKVNKANYKAKCGITTNVVLMSISYTPAVGMSRFDFV